MTDQQSFLVRRATYVRTVQVRSDRTALATLKATNRQMHFGALLLDLERFPKCEEDKAEVKKGLIAAIPRDKPHSATIYLIKMAKGIHFEQVVEDTERLKLRFASPYELAAVNEAEPNFQWTFPQQTYWQNRKGFWFMLGVCDRRTLFLSGALPRGELDRSRFFAFAER